MGANVKVEGNSSNDRRRGRISGARVSAPDLRAGAHFASQVLQQMESQL